MVDELEVINNINEVNRLLLDSLNTNKVQFGPFRGMQLLKDSVWDPQAIGLKLLGLYEYELHSTFFKAIERQPKTIVNVGCAEGYYAIGMALALLNSKVYAVDIDKQSLVLCREAIKLNQVTDRVRIPNSEKFIPKNPSLMIVDCESCEDKLFAVPEKYTNSDLIIECHELEIPGITLALEARFKDSHDIEVINPLEDFKFTFTINNVELFLQENRWGGIKWLVAWSRK